MANHEDPCTICGNPLGHYMAYIKKVDAHPLCTERKGFQDRIAVLEAALKPFAHMASQFHRQPMLNVGDTLYGIHAGDPAEAEIKWTDCEVALKALYPERTKEADEAIERFKNPGKGWREYVLKRRSTWCEICEDDHLPGQHEK
jgi:hypothetical protein